MATAFTTAIEAWDKRWSTAEGRADWLDPDPDVRALLPELKARGARSALDLGCGVGRHALFLVEHGPAVEATAGLAVMREIVRARGVSLGSATRNGRRAGFELLSLKQQQHRKPGSWHWHIIAERRPQETI
jgi:SAM-dependent methyltransferase